MQVNATKHEVWLVETRFHFLLTYPLTGSQDYLVTNLDSLNVNMGIWVLKDHILHDEMYVHCANVVYALCFFMIWS